MPFITCVEQEFEAMGAKIKVTIQATSKDVCEEVRKTKGDVNAFVGLLKMHGGYDVKSEKPLEILSNDGKIRVVMEPRNIVAQMFWKEVVKRVREASK
ncbi:MAG: hypothetical protein QXL22_02760 [Candidatus Nezhaarchaeales archaeon]